MIRSFNVMLLVVCIVCFTGVYALKFSIEHTAGEKRALELRIEDQRAELSLLEADWAFLIQPGNIAPIVRRHQDVLMLAEVRSEQFAGFGGLPMRPAAPDAGALDDLFQMLDAGYDPIGSILEELD